jgi:hypothetical protein
MTLHVRSGTATPAAVVGSAVIGSESDASLGTLTRDGLDAADAWSTL